MSSTTHAPILYYIQAYELLERNQLQCLKTGLSRLDKVLLGGFRRGAVTEVKEPILGCPVVAIILQNQLCAKQVNKPILYYDLYR